MREKNQSKKITGLNEVYTEISSKTINHDDLRIVVSISKKTSFVFKTDKFGETIAVEKRK